MKNFHTLHVINTITLFATVIFVLLPLALMMIISVLTPNDTTFFSGPITLTNYKELFDPIVVKILLKSFSLAFMTTALCLGIAFPFSYVIARHPYHQLLFILCIIPFWTSSLVRTYALLAILKTHGLLNNLLLKLHLISSPLELLYTNTTVLIGMVYNLLPFAILPLYTTFLKFNFTLIDAANDLGANNWQKLRFILIPHSQNSIVAAILMTFLPAMTLFFIPNILGGAKSIFIGNYIENLFLFSNQWPKGAAISVVLTLLMVALLGFGQKRESR